MKVKIYLTQEEVSYLIERCKRKGKKLTREALYQALVKPGNFITKVAEEIAIPIDGEINLEAKKTSTKNIECKHPGILNIPEGKHFYSVGLKHYINLAKRKGKGAIMRALLNLYRWNKNKNPKISAKAKKIINSLKNNSEWKKL